MPFETGPYLSAALICEKVLIEQDGVKSLVRIFDRTTQTVVGPDPPREMDPFEITLYLFISFKAGAARGPMNVELELQRPNGEAERAVSQVLYFEGEDDRGEGLDKLPRSLTARQGVWRPGPGRGRVGAVPSRQTKGTHP